MKIEIDENIKITKTDSLLIVQHSDLDITIYQLHTTTGNRLLIKSLPRNQNRQFQFKVTTLIITSGQLINQETYKSEFFQAGSNADVKEKIYRKFVKNDEIARPL